jgi:hypothetical protein
MDECIWAFAATILTGETELVGEKSFTVSVVDGLMIMEHWWCDTEYRNRIIGGKTLYSVGGKLMNEYGTLLE